VKVVAVTTRVESADLDRPAFQLLDLGRQAGRQEITASHDSDQDQVLRPPVAFEDLVRDPKEGTPHRLAVHHNPGAATGLHPLPRRKGR
jgi:hypothetical protein